jgi:hypothetical protein
MLWSRTPTDAHLPEELEIRVNEEPTLKCDPGHINYTLVRM